MLAEPSALARNTSYFTLALVAQKIISFLYFTFLARIFGPESIGKYVFALSLTTLFSVLLDLGLANVLTREVARQPASAERYGRLVIGFKLVAMFIVVALALVFIWLAGYGVLARQLVYIATIVMVLDSFTLTSYSTIRGFHNLTWESIGTVLMQAIAAGGGVIVSLFTRDLRWFMASLALAALVNCLYSLWQLHWRYKVNIKPRFDVVDYKFLARLTWPFALAAILTRFYGYLDTVLLSLLSGDRAVGIYSVAYKITFALQFIPAAFSASLFPGFSSYFSSAPEKLANIFMKGVIYLTVIAVPVALGIIALAPEIINTIYPAFAEAVLPLQVLVFSLIFLFITFPVGALLPACDKQLRQTGNLALAAASNLLLNIVLIPVLGPLGAAISSLVSTIVLLVAGVWVVRQLVVLDLKYLVVKLSKVVFTGLIMFCVAIWLKHSVNFLLTIPISALVYIVLLFLLKGITRQEIRDLLKIIFKRQPASSL